MKKDTVEEKELTEFQKMAGLNVNEYTEKKNNLTYLSWASAWREFCKVYEHAHYNIKEWEGKPYFYDQHLGYLVGTEVDNGNGQVKRMYLPVMDSSNKAMKAEEYTYKVKEYYNYKWTGKYIDKRVEPATMFDINTAIMRCLTKNLALFGLGLYIYAGEDLPEDNSDTPKVPEVIPEPTPEEKAKVVKGNIQEFNL